MRTMSFGPIIRAAGDDPTRYLRASHFRINLLDDDDNLISDEKIRFERPLFEDNPQELENFKDFLQRLDDIIPTFVMDVKIDEFSVIVFYKTQDAEIFIRKHALPPIDIE